MQQDGWRVAEEMLHAAVDKPWSLPRNLVPLGQNLHVAFFQAIDSISSTSGHHQRSSPGALSRRET